MPESTPGTCLCFDYGTHRIGLAIGEYQLKSANPIGIANNVNGTPEWLTIDNVIAQWQPTDLVVGWPLTENLEMQSITYHVRGFIKRLAKRYDLPVHKADERFTSMAAQQEIKQMRSSGQRKRKTSHQDIDTLAAALILESWFAMESLS